MTIGGDPSETAELTFGPIGQCCVRSSSGHARPLFDQWSAVVLHDNRPARVLAAQLHTVDAPLVVMATGVRGMISQLSSTHTAAGLLGAINCPALVLGPNVPDTWVVRWLEPFGGRDPYFVAVEIARHRAHASVHPVLVVPYGCNDAR